ncbi:MAG: D-hexose-6-phosphate mutarotase, partial [Cocleimonas sp.]
MTLAKQYIAFIINNELQVIEGEGGLPVIKIDNEYATALISIYGAQVLSYKKKSSNSSKQSEDNELLFLSDKAYYDAGKAIKGGIPICWPWFGQDPEKKGRPAHGFARNVMWELVSTSSSNTSTQIVLALSETEETKKLWPYLFKLSLTIDIGKTLKLSLKTRNTDTQAFTITQALHTYFAVGDIEKVRIAGLDKSDFIDAALESVPVLNQEGDVVFDQEVDRIYKQGSVLTLFDGSNRQVKI